MAFFCISTPCKRTSPTFRRNVQPSSAGRSIWVRWVLKWLDIRISVISAVPESSWCRVPLVTLLRPLLNGGGGGLPRVGCANCVCTSSGINPSRLHGLVVDNFHDDTQFCSLCSTVFSRVTIFYTVQTTMVKFPTRHRCFGLALQVQPCGQKRLEACNLWLVLQPAEHVNSSALARDVEHVWRFKPRASLNGRSRPEIWGGRQFECLDAVF